MKGARVVRTDAPCSGRDLKVYVVGEKSWAMAKPRPTRMTRDETGMPAPLPPNTRVAPLACGQALGLAPRSLGSVRP